MRFEINAARVIGVLLPAAELARRRLHITPISGYVDDFIMGALLVVAAHAAATGRPSGPAQLVAAWAVLCGGLYYSFFGQIERGASPDVSGLSNGTVIVIKGALYAVAIVALIRSIRAASRESL